MLYKPIIIEEKFEETNVEIKEIFKLYQERVTSELWKDSVFISEEESKKYPGIQINLFSLQGFFKDLYYNNERIYPPIIVNFKNKTKNEIYRIFTKKFFNKIYNEYNFINPLLEKNDIYIEFNINDSELFDKIESNYTIEDIIEEDYTNFYKISFDEKKIGKEICPYDLTLNYKYYIASPSPEIKVKYVLPHERIKNIKSIINQQEKIYAICGPYGIGKTTSLLILCKSLKKERCCYLNLKALNENKLNVQIWKYRLFLTELFSIFREEYFHFMELKKILIKIKTFWEAIFESIKYCIKNQIKAIFIFDQYQEKLDNDFSELKKIKDLVYNDTFNNIKIIISSSINNKDIREFLIQKFILKKSVLDLLLNYHYFTNIFKLEYIEGLIDQLSPKKKEICEKNFSNIPSYFYRILECEENLLDKLVNSIKISIIKQINNFFEENNINYENLCFLVENYLKIGVKNSYQEKSNFNKIELENIIRIIPIKFFELEIINNSIINIQFYFPLAKYCFLEALYSKIFLLLKNPKINFPERVIGDLLETVVIENLKQMNSEKIDQICYTNKLWKMEYIKDLDLSQVNDNNILIIQQKDNAELVDFGILLKGKSLILFQVKKALTELPKNFITINKIKNKQKTLENSFKKYFSCNIKKIYLVYITGIYFTNKLYNEYHTWTKNENDFMILKKICEEDNIPLIYMDVFEKKFLFENKDIFSETSLTGEFSQIFNPEYNYVSITDLETRLIEKFEDLKYDINENINDSIMDLQFNKKGIDINDKKIIENKIDRELDLEEHISIKNPNISFIMRKNKNIVNYFKIGQKKYFSYYDNENKKIQINQINTGLSIESNLFKINQLEVFYLKKKKKYSD